MNKALNQQKKRHNIISFFPDGDFYFTKGVEAFKKKKFDIALKWLKKAIETNPDDPLYNCQMSIVYTETGSYYKANELLHHVLETSEYTDCYYLLANNFAHLGLLAETNKYARLYLDKNPAGEFTEEAYALLDLIDFELEDEFDDDWLLEEEDDLLKYQETVFYLMENGECKKAMPLIEEMLLLFPDYLVVKHDYAEALFYTGEEDKAIMLEEKILDEMKHSLQSNMNLALFYYETGDKEAYEMTINNLENIHPLHGDQQVKLAATFAKTGNYEEAYKKFKKVSKRAGRGHLSYYKWFSISAYSIGKTDEAARLWKEGCVKHRLLLNHDSPWSE